MDSHQIAANQQQLKNILAECSIQDNKLSAISQKNLPLFVEVEREQKNIKMAVNAINDYKNQVTDEVFVSKNETQFIERYNFNF